MSGCKTTKIRTEVKYILPPKPQRKELTAPKELKDYAEIINYYEHLVQEWEAWGNTVSDMVNYRVE